MKRTKEQIRKAFIASEIQSMTATLDNLLTHYVAVREPVSVHESNVEAFLQHAGNLLVEAHSEAKAMALPPKKRKPAGAEAGR